MCRFVGPLSGGTILAALCVAALHGSPVSAQTVIDHKPVACAVAEKFARFEARFEPAASLARAEIHFRTEATSDWYAAPMNRDGAAFFGVLPKPKKSLKSFRYYIEATDSAFGTSRTQEYSTSVVDGAVACQNKIMAGALGSASVLLRAPAGAALVPGGFASTGVVAAGAGSAASTAGAAGGGGGGFPTGWVLGVGAAGAAAAGVVVATRDSTRLLEIRGQVFATNSGGPSNPVSGAVVSTSLDAATAVSDGNGVFDLTTQTPETDDECGFYTITIVATGHPTYSVTGRWGRRSLGRGQPIQFSLSPPYPAANSIVKPQCPTM